MVDILTLFAQLFCFHRTNYIILPTLTQSSVFGACLTLWFTILALYTLQLLDLEDLSQKTLYVGPTNVDLMLAHRRRRWKHNTLDRPMLV